MHRLPDVRVLFAAQGLVIEKTKAMQLRAPH
jgi:hypothetical protein